MSRDPRIELAVAVVSFNTRELLERCLRSVAAAGAATVVVVDNGSTDGSIELVREQFAGVRLVVMERNHGYGAAANVAFAACDAPALLLLNSDTVVAPDVLAVLARHLAEHPGAAIVGPRLANPDGSLQPSTFPFPSPPDLLMGETGLHLLVRRVPRLRERWLRTWSHDEARAVPWVIGAALAIRRGPFEAVGGFDESYFMYWEEVDLARRLADAGYGTHFEPATTVMHVGEASTAQHAAGMRREWLAGQRRYLCCHERRGRVALFLRMQRVLNLTRVARDRMRRVVARDPARRELLDASLTARRTLLAERELWRA